MALPTLVFSVALPAIADTGADCPGILMPNARLVDGVCLHDEVETDLSLEDLEEVDGAYSYACEVGSKHAFYGRLSDPVGDVFITYLFDSDGELVGERRSTSDVPAWCCEGEKVQEVRWGEDAGLCTAPLRRDPTGQSECDDATAKVDSANRRPVGFLAAGVLLVGVLGVGRRVRA